MDVARLNFSQGTYEQHAQTIANLREISEELLYTPVTILQDLQGPKIRVGQLTGGEMPLTPGTTVAMIRRLISLVSLPRFRWTMHTLPKSRPSPACASS